MAYDKTTWQNGQAPYINENNLNKIEQGIYDNSIDIEDLETNVGDLTNLETTNKSSLVTAINETLKVNKYSTTETVVGEWLDGKPLYRKVLTHTFSSYTSSNYLDLNTGLQNASIKDIRAVINRANGYITPRGYYWDIGFIVSDTQQMRLFDNGNIFSAGSVFYITLEYTKTTD